MSSEKLYHYEEWENNRKVTKTKGGRYTAKNIIGKSLEDVQWSEGHWIAPNQTAYFIMDLRCKQTIDQLILWNFSTKEFKVSLSTSKTGPWTEVLRASFNTKLIKYEAYDYDQSYDLETFNFNSTLAKYLKFELISCWDKCGLKYIRVRNSRGIY